MSDVVVVGGGFAGCAVALSLAARGVAVTVVEAEEIGGAATIASAGMLAPQYECDGPGALFRILVQCRRYFPEFASGLRDLAGCSLPLRWDGMLVANLTDEEHRGAAEMAEWQRDGGEAAELVGVSEALRLQPGVTADARSYLWLPNEGQVDSQRLPAALSAGLDAAAVRTIRRCAVVRIRGRAGRVEGVELEDGRTLDADRVVVASGAWSGGLAGLPRALPVRPVRGHLLRFAGPELRLDRLVAGHAGRYLVPRNDGSVLAGSTMEESGFDRSVNDAQLRIIHAAAGRLVPVLDRLRPSEYWADVRPISIDQNPILGPDPDMAGLFHASGYGRNGILLSPLAGSVLADQICGAHLPADWANFSPARFSDGSPADQG